MRLSEKYQTIIKETFAEVFPAGDRLWLFGSRVDDTKKGGDIDLYIETNLENHEDSRKLKITFWSKLQLRLGEQRIDIVIKSLKKNESLPIYEEARRTGIILV